MNFRCFCVYVNVIQTNWQTDDYKFYCHVYHVRVIYSHTVLCTILIYLCYVFYVVFVNCMLISIHTKCSQCYNIDLINQSIGSNYKNKMNYIHFQVNEMREKGTKCLILLFIVMFCIIVIINYYTNVKLNIPSLSLSFGHFVYFYNLFELFLCCDILLLKKEVRLRNDNIHFFTFNVCI